MPPAGSESSLILVADDVDANVELLADQLAALGFRTVIAHDGPGALAACYEHRPDLCILDVSMPAGELGVDDRDTGFEVCRRLKRDPRSSRIGQALVAAATPLELPFRGGWVVFLGYELAGRIESCCTSSSGATSRCATSKPSSGPPGRSCSLCS